MGAAACLNSWHVSGQTILMPGFDYDSFGCTSQVEKPRSEYLASRDAFYLHGLYINSVDVRQARPSCCQPKGTNASNHFAAGSSCVHVLRLWEAAEATWLQCYWKHG